MTVQRDMFDGDPFAPEPIPAAPDPVARVDEPAPAGGDHDGNAVALAPLAVPCGFRNSTLTVGYANPKDDARFADRTDRSSQSAMISQPGGA